MKLEGPVRRNPTQPLYARKTLPLTITSVMLIADCFTDQAHSAELKHSNLYLCTWTINPNNKHCIRHACKHRRTRTCTRMHAPMFAPMCAPNCWHLHTHILYKAKYLEGEKDDSESLYGDHHNVPAAARLCSFPNHKHQATGGIHK